MLHNTIRFLRQHDSPRLRRGVRIVLWVVWLGYTSLLFTATHATIPDKVAGVTSQWDKLLHLGAYTVLSVLTAAVCLRTAPLRIPYRWIFPVLMVFAAFDEILQGPVGRSPDVIDWLFDCLGIAVGLLACFAAIRVYESQSSDRPLFSFAKHWWKERTTREASGLAP